MSLRGVRVHIAGSAALDTESELLAAAHEFVRQVTRGAIDKGGGLVTGAAGEPLGDSGLPCIFDWTALETISASADPAPEWPAARKARFFAVGTQSGLEKIPDWRADVWRTCQLRSDFELATTPRGWRMGGVLRELQVRQGDVLLVLGGGAGGEHLAALYLDDGKPVVAMHSALRGISDDGNGGGRYLHERALNDIESFFRLAHGEGGAAARLSTLRLTADGDVGQLASDTVALLEALRPPLAFYVRLLAREHEEFQKVEAFFRDVVDVVAREEGYTPHEVGHDEPLAAFINVEIFEGLHRAGLVVIDLTGVRPNCMMELGYALGRRRRVILTALTGTRLPFDPDKLPTYFWTNEGTVAERASSFRDWFERFIDLPPIVE
jgi:hypothetical protein